MRLYTFEFRLAILVACFVSLILSFVFGYIYNINTSSYFITYISSENKRPKMRASETEDGFAIVTRKTKNESSAIRPTSRERQNNQCGLILFVHINKCAGQSLAYWFYHCAAGYLKLADKGNHYRVIKVKNVSGSRVEWEEMATKATSFVSSISRNIGWKVLEIHHGFPGMYYSQEIIQQWQRIVEGNGCVFHKTTMLRDPLDRFVSNVNWNKPPLKDIDTFMESRRNWLSRYFLFGICGYYNRKLRCGYDRAGNFTMTPNLNQVYVKEMKQIITTFDSVGFTDMFEEYLGNIKRVTGWKDDDMQRSKRTKNCYSFTDKNCKTVHKSIKTFSLTSSILTKFLKLNQEDYYLYYTMKNEIKPLLFNGYDNRIVRISQHA